MKKSIITLGLAAFILSTGIASADMAFKTHSEAYHPMFGTGIGGGFGANHNVGTGVDSAAAVQATANEWANSDKEEADVVIKDNSKPKSEFVPASTNLGNGEGYSYEKGKDGYIYGYATGGEQGVNGTKTIYTDGIGRIHFFGKKNKIKD